MAPNTTSFTNPLKRVSRACVHCRQRKSKCDLDVSGGSPPCQRCIKDGRECVLATSNRGGSRIRKKNLSLGHLPTGPSASPLKQELPFAQTSAPGIQYNNIPQDNSLNALSATRTPETPIESVATSAASAEPDDDSISNADSTIPTTLPSNPSDAWQNLQELHGSEEAAPAGYKAGMDHLNGDHIGMATHFVSTKGVMSYRLVREGHLTPSIISSLVSHYHRNYHAYLPLVPRQYFDPTQLDIFAAQNKHLLTAVLTIASKDEVANLYLHECCSRYMHDLISGIAAGIDCGVESVEALLLLAEWEPQGLRNRVESVGKGEEDRAAWMHVGTALRVGNFLGLERTSFRNEANEATEESDLHARKRLAWASCYVSDRLISLRIGKGFWARGPGPMTGFSGQDFPSLKPMLTGDEDYAAIFHANLELTQLYSNVHDVLYTGMRTSGQMMLRGDYVKYIDEFRHSIARWHVNWGDLICAPHIKVTLRMSYEYLCLYTNAFAFQAAISQILSKKPDEDDVNLRDYLKTFFSEIGSLQDARFILESLRAAKSYLRILTTDIDPVQYLRYMPVRFYLYSIYSAVFLFKARSFGALKRDEEHEIRQIMSQTVAILRQASNSSHDPGSRYAQLLERLWQRPKVAPPASGPDIKWTDPQASKIYSDPHPEPISQIPFSEVSPSNLPSWLDLQQIGNYVSGDPNIYAPLSAMDTSPFSQNQSQAGSMFPQYGPRPYEVTGNAFIF